MIGRRKFIGLLGGAAAAWSLSARAQQTERMRRIGVLMAVAEHDLEAQGYIKAFVQALHELGWAHGRNVQIEFAGARVISTAFGPTQPSSWGSNQMLFLRRPRWLWRHCSG